MAKQITVQEFVLKALAVDSPYRGVDKKTGKAYKGIHTRYSGFNEDFRAYFDSDPIEATQALAEEGVIVIRPTRGGVTLYLPEDVPASKSDERLKALGLK